MKCDLPLFILPNISLQSDKSFHMWKRSSDLTRNTSKWESPILMKCGSKRSFQKNIWPLFFFLSAIVDDLKEWNLNLGARYIFILLSNIYRFLCKLMKLVFFLTTNLILFKQYI